MIRETHRWYGVAAIAFFAAGAGVIASRPALLLASVVGVAYVAYARTAGAPTVTLKVERRLSDPEPDPGEPVEVTVRATNEGPLLADLRLVDGVPDGLAVSDGSPRHATALRRGRVVEFGYTVEAARGEHAFGPLTVIARDASGAVERETEVEVEVETTLTCVPPLPPSTISVPLRTQTAQYTGPVATRGGGSGVEFYTTRDYRAGDAMTRVDWNRLARTGELSTVEFREERSATVVLVLDARPEAYVGGEDHAVEREIEAARLSFTSLLDAGHRVGIGAIGSTSCWLAPSSGEAHRTAARRLLAVHPALSPMPPTAPIIVTQRVRGLRGNFPANAQVILLSPLADDYIVTIAARLDAHGHAVSVVTPDVTGDATAGQRLARVERRARIDRLRSRRLPVIDWPADVTFERAVAAAREGRWR